MSLLYIEKLFLMFLLYSFLGWLIETIGGLITNKKFINRGFLLGPYCPIYGTGVILITLLLSKYKEDPTTLFFLSGLLCGTLEYITSFVMEKVFKSRWWDYSNMRFNINGRICLETLVLFAFAGLLVLGITNPLLESLLYKLPDILVHIITGILFILFVIDCIVSLNIINSIKQIKVTVSNQVKDNTDEISAKVKAIIMEKSSSYRRLIAAFPHAFATKIKENIQDVKDKAIDIKEKALDNINENKKKFLKNYKAKTRLSLMKIYKKK